MLILCNFNVTNRTQLKIKGYILFFILLFLVKGKFSDAQSTDQGVKFDFYGDPVELAIDPSLIINFGSTISEEAIHSFYENIDNSHYKSLINSLKDCKSKYQLDDWLYYQLIRKTVQQISPKEDNYYRYTLYKWFLLNKSGYDATLSLCDNQLLLYVQSNEEIYNIPFHTKNGKQYVCLNYHDYGGNIDFSKKNFTELPFYFSEGYKAFTYKITQLPEFTPDSYFEKDIKFNYYQTDYHFKVKLTPQVQTIFANYPVVDYSYYMNIPLSKETYYSLIPELKKNMKGMSEKEGVDFLMRFTRYAFIFQPDIKVFGAEKRLSPEETLLYNNSDCEDRAALFFYLVKEIYNLPMLVLTYPKHVTIAVNFEKPIGNTITYNGKKYSVCEPTPQKRDLKLGELLPELRKTPYEIAYEYNPLKTQ